MKTIKAFEIGLYADGMKFQENIFYEIPLKNVKLYQSGFTASNNFDIYDTIEFYPDLIKTEYALVDINPIYSSLNIVYGDRIKILKKLSLDECINYDKTGLWTIEYVVQIKPENILNFQQQIIKKDINGKACYNFAKKVKGADLQLLMDEVIKKDTYGGYCYLYAKYIPIPNYLKKDLENAIIGKGNCDIIYQYAFYVTGADIEKLENAIIKYDKTGYWCDIFANTIKEANVSKLKNAIKMKRSNE